MSFFSRKRHPSQSTGQPSAATPPPQQAPPAQREVLDNGVVQPSGINERDDRCVLAEKNCFSSLLILTVVRDSNFQHAISPRATNCCHFIQRSYSETARWPKFHPSPPTSSVSMVIPRAHFASTRTFTTTRASAADNSLTLTISSLWTLNTTQLHRLRGTFPLWWSGEGERA